MFSPHRIRDLEETSETFEPNPDFRIVDYLDAGFRKLRGDGKLQTIRLRFAPTAARYVSEKIWHPSQKLRHHTDGSLTMTIRVNHLLEVKRWVLSFGAECQVLGPNTLRTSIAGELQEMCNCYTPVK
jgi:proteasome accessory factor B